MCQGGIACKIHSLCMAGSCRESNRYKCWLLLHYRNHQNKNCIVQQRGWKIYRQHTWHSHCCRSQRRRCPPRSSSTPFALTFLEWCQGRMRCMIRNHSRTKMSRRRMQYNFLHRQEHTFPLDKHRNWPFQPRISFQQHNSHTQLRSSDHFDHYTCRQSKQRMWSRMHPCRHHMCHTCSYSPERQSR